MILMVSCWAIAAQEVSTAATINDARRCSLREPSRKTGPSSRDLGERARGVNRVKVVSHAGRPCTANIFCLPKVMLGAGLCESIRKRGGRCTRQNEAYRFASWRTWKTLHFSENKPRCAAVKLATVQTRCCK